MEYNCLFCYTISIITIYKSFNVIANGFDYIKPKINLENVMEFAVFW